jgi:hypothetical protein
MTSSKAAAQFLMGGSEVAGTAVQADGRSPGQSGRAPDSPARVPYDDGWERRY